MIGHNGGNLQFTKLHGSFYTKEVLGAGNQGGAEGHAHITGLQALNDFMVFSRIIQLYLVVKIKSCLGVIVQVHLQFFPDFSLNRYINLLVKLKVAKALLLNRHIWIGNALKLTAEIKHYRPIGADVDEITAKNPVKHGREVYFGYQGFSRGRRFSILSLCFCLQIAFLEFILHVLFILLKSHGTHRPVIQLPDFFVNGIGAGKGVYLYFCFDGFRILQ